MNKFFTVISLLLIVAYANCTKKVSYSQIVSSLSQISQVEGAASLVDSVTASMNKGLKDLALFRTALQNECGALV